MHIASRKYRIRENDSNGFVSKAFQMEPHYEDVVDNPTSMISITKWNGGHLIYRFT
jgi:hypothetical protein